MYASSQIFFNRSIHYAYQAVSYLALPYIPFCELYLAVMVLGLDAFSSTGDTANT
jgi:hypothetical protein